LPASYPPSFGRSIASLCHFDRRNVIGAVDRSSREMRSTGLQPPLLQSGSGGSRGHQSCRGEGGTTAGEILKPIMWPIIRSTPDVRPGTTPDEKTEMRYPTRASEPVHRRLWVLPSPLHDPSVQELHDESSWRWETVRCALDWGHQSGMDCRSGNSDGNGSICSAVGTLSLY
jgi:hypothetical protein